MAVCPRCGVECPNDVAFCVDCGARMGGRHTIAAGSRGSQSGAIALDDPQWDQTEADAAEALARTDTMDAHGEQTVNEPARRLGTIVGSYRLEQLLGEGGMGFVYLAEHVRLGRRVALKMLRQELASTPQVVKRFFAEARAVNRILHENIVEITDFVENQGGENYFIMELLRGNDLRTVLGEERVLPLPRALGIGVQVCSGLAAVHDAGIVHRDLKPENIFLTERGGRKDFVKLLDFGIAKLVDQVTGLSVNTQHTAAGTIIGTPEYMSPEQACAREVDYRTDIYSLGVILYELTTGRKPFVAKSFGDLVVLHATTVPSRPGKVKDLPTPIPRDLDDLIMSCLEREPHKRPGSMKILEERLRAIGESLSLELESFTAAPIKNLTRTMSRSRSRMAAAGLGVAAAAVLLAVGFSSGDERSLPALHVQVPQAAAPAPSPEPSPEPAAPARTVDLRFDSNPPRAEVVAKKNPGKILGYTPFTLSVPASEATETFRFRLEGYEDAEEDTPMAESTRVKVRLAKAHRPTRAAGIASPGGKPDKSETPAEAQKQTPKSKELNDPFDDD